MEVPGYADLVAIGRGGFSTVFRARQVAVDREVAIKVLSVDLVDDAARARFRRECATNGRVGAHPGIVTVHDSGFTSDGHPFLSLQLCPDGSLGDALRHRGPLPIAEVLHTGVSVSAALAYAHSAGVMHRDIKPENILLSPFGEPLLADFGIATVDDQRVSTATAASFTINHAAPECLAGQPASAAADVYSLSSTLYTLLAGHPPFTTSSAAALVSLLSMVMNDPAPPLTRPDVPASLNAVLLAGLAKTPAGRPPDATAFGHALQGIQAELGLPVTPWLTAPPPVPQDDISTQQTAPYPPPEGHQATGSVTPSPVEPVLPVAAPALIPEAIPPSMPTQSGPVGGLAPNVTVMGMRPQPPVTTPPATEPPMRQPRRRMAAMLTAAAVVVALLAGAGVYHLATRDAAGSAGPAAPGTSLTTPATGPADGTGSTDASPTASGTGPSDTGSSGSVSTGTTPADGSAAGGQTQTPDPGHPIPVVPPATTRRTSSPAVTTTVTTPSTPRTTTTPPAPPAIESFTDIAYGGGPVECGAQSTVPLQFTWSAPTATTAWIGVDTGGDASAAPFYSDLPPVVGPTNASTPYVEVPFACSTPQHSYTVTVQGPTGKTSRTITYVRSATSAPTTSAVTTGAGFTTITRPGGIPTQVITRDPLLTVTRIQQPLPPVPGG